MGELCRIHDIFLDPNSEFSWSKMISCPKFAFETLRYVVFFFSVCLQGGN